MHGLNNLSNIHISLYDLVPLMIDLLRFIHIVFNITFSAEYTATEYFKFNKFIETAEFDVVYVACKTCYLVDFGLE